MSKNGKKWLSVTEAAQLLGIPRHKVFREMKLGRIRCARIGWTHLISAKSLKEYRKTLSEASTR